MRRSGVTWPLSGLTPLTGAMTGMQIVMVTTAMMSQAKEASARRFTCLMGMSDATAPMQRTATAMPNWPSCVAAGDLPAGVAKPKWNIWLMETTCCIACSE